MKVFVDECVDWRLARDIVGHEVKTARQMGWSTIKNGELLALAAGEFEVFVTVDRNLSFQQNLPAFAIAVIVLRATSNRLADLKPLVPELLACIPGAKRGTVAYVGGYNFRSNGRAISAAPYQLFVPARRSPRRYAAVGRRGLLRGAQQRMMAHGQDIPAQETAEIL